MTDTKWNQARLPFGACLLGHGLPFCSSLRSFDGCQLVLLGWCDMSRRVLAEIVANVLI